MPTGRSPDHNDQWYLDVNGKKFGPYTMAQIEALVRHNEIVGEDKITSSHLEGKWLSVQEFIKKQKSDSPASHLGTSSRPAAVPPRPDEKTLSSITIPRPHASRNQEADAVSNLFEILQAAREKKPIGSQSHVVSETPQPVQGSGFPLFWIGIPAAILGTVVFFKLTASTPTAAPESDAKIAKRSAPVSSQNTNPITVSTPIAVAANIPKAKPPTVAPHALAPVRPVNVKPIALAASTAADQERERELSREKEREREREMEREAERERERERERENEFASSRDFDRRERERERDLEKVDRSAASMAGSNPSTPFGSPFGSPLNPGDPDSSSATFANPQ